MVPGSGKEAWGMLVKEEGAEAGGSGTGNGGDGGEAPCGHGYDGDGWQQPSKVCSCASRGEEKLDPDP